MKNRQWHKPPQSVFVSKQNGPFLSKTGSVDFFLFLKTFTTTVTGCLICLKTLHFHAAQYNFTIAGFDENTDDNSRLEGCTFNH